MISFLSNNLRARLILLVLMAIIPALMVTLFSGLQQRGLARSKAENDAYGFTRLVANHQSARVEGARQMLLSISVNDAVYNPALCGEYLSKLNGIYPMYSAISIADPNGQVICSSISMNPLPSVADRDYFQEAKRTGEFATGQITIGKVTNQPIQPVAMPVYSPAGNLSAVLIAALDFNQTIQFLTTLNLPSDSAILFIDREGTIITRYPNSAQWAGQKMPDVPIINQILLRADEGKIEVEGVDGVRRLYAFTPIENRSMFISVGIPSRIAYAEANRTLYNNLLWLGATALIALSVAWFGGDVLFLRVVSLTAERDKAENRLRELNADLENQVGQRTSELANANQQLKYQLEERQRTLSILRQRELEMKELVKALERSNGDLQDFAFIASHDLQEPLRKIQAFGERLQRRYSDQLGEEGKDFINRMMTSAYRMQAMINDLLSYSRVTTRGQNFEITNLNTIVKEVLTDLEIRIRDTRGQVIVSELPTIFADSMQMRQLFQNLISNALKFHRAGVPPIVKIFALPPDSAAPEDGLERPPGSMVTLCVEDNGIGFDTKYTDRIFQPFQRLHSKNEYEGSGIGLAICRKIAERHGGEITACSQPNQGSRFDITMLRKSEQK